MADITNAQVVAYTQQYARPIADKLEILLSDLQDATAEYGTLGIATLLSGAANGDTIADGYQDGRNPVTKLQLSNFKAAIDAVITALNVTTVVGVGATPKAIMDPIQVNGLLPR